MIIMLSNAFLEVSKINLSYYLAHIGLIADSLVLIDYVNIGGLKARNPTIDLDIDVLSTCDTIPLCKLNANRKRFNLIFILLVPLKDLFHLITQSKSELAILLVTFMVPSS